MLLKVMDPIDRQLFFCSTYMQVGDDNSTSFWEARWLLVSAPKYLAPNLFEIVRFKGGQLPLNFTITTGLEISAISALVCCCRSLLSFSWL
jgi:hypothetical protein